uniref:Reverse transcriptase domain-containing protein n=1 Tax=Trichogramma kaykai TaxID=54128 RepID=A0ABD2W2H6_9HYME
MKTAVKLIGPGAYMLSIDMADAYLTVPVRRADQRYLKFYFNKKLYKFVCLPFGLSTSPYVFTKILKPVVQKLRTAVNLSVIYLDVILCIGDTNKECAENARATKE